MPERGDGDSDLERKLFIGGLGYQTTDEGLKEYYEQWGKVVDHIVMKDPKTRRSRGFGFITYSEACMVDSAMAALPHCVDGRQVDPKRAIPREECGKTEGNVVHKLFLGGLARSVTTDDLKDYFGQYGKMTDCSIVVMKETGESRGFGFVEYEDAETADKVFMIKEHTLAGRQVDVKKAVAKEELRAAEREAFRGGGRGRGDSYRGRGGRDSYRGGWNDYGSSSWGGSGGGSGNNSWGGAGNGANWGGNAWNTGWGGSGGYNNMGWMGNMAGVGGMAVNPTGGYGGGYGSTGGYQNAAAGADDSSGYNSGAAAGSEGYNSLGGAYGDNASGGGPMRTSYHSNNRSAPYSTSGGGYGGRGGGANGRSDFN